MTPEEVQDLIAEAKELEIRGKQRLKQTSEYDELLQLNK